ncbi:MAG: MarC family protein [Methylococcaceae bacterium]
MISLLITLKIIPMIFMALFPVVNPIGTALILFGMTRGVDDQTWKSMSRRIALYSFLFLSFFFFFGSYILKMFGISIPVVQFSGGIVLALMGWQLLNQKETSKPVSEKNPDHTGLSIEPKAFYPFTFPLTVGPGGMAVVLTFSAHLNQESMLLLTLERGAAIIGIFLMCVVVSLCYRNLKFMIRRFSATGALAISKVLAFFVLCIGVEIAWAGFKALGH